MVSLTPNILNKRSFDLFWLQEEQVGSLCSSNLHHGPMDSSKRTNTEINIFQQAAAICGCVKVIERPWAQKLLGEMQRGGRTSFTLNPNFLDICREAGISIPFEEIDDQTYQNNIERRLQKSISPEGGRRSAEQER